MTLDEWAAATPEPVLAGLVKVWHGQGRRRRHLPTIPLPMDCADPDVVAARAWLAERVDLLAAHLAEIWVHRDDLDQSGPCEGDRRIASRSVVLSRMADGTM